MSGNGAADLLPCYPDVRSFHQMMNFDTLFPLVNIDTENEILEDIKIMQYIIYNLEYFRKIISYVG